MSKRVNKTFVISLLLVCIFTISAFAVDYEPFANDPIQTHEANLIAGSSNAVLSFTVATRQSKSKLGILMYTLYDQTTGKNTPKNVAKYISGKYYQESLVIPNLIAGHTYYLMVTFYADGSTYSQVTNSVRIR